MLSTLYPDLVMVGKDSEIEIFRGLRLPLDQGGCHATAHQYNSYELFEHIKDVNFDCAIRSEKRIAANLPAGMATIVDNGPLTGSESKCTSLISYVLDYHLTAMEGEGFIKEAWDKHLQRTATIECIAGPNNGGGLEDMVSLSVYDVGGVFIVHAVLSFLAIALATYQFYVKARSKEIDDDRTLHTVFGVHHVMKFSNSRGFQSESHSEKPECDTRSRIPDDTTSSRIPDDTTSNRTPDDTTCNRISDDRLAIGERTEL
jgi:hypothetical protein